MKKDLNNVFAEFVTALLSNRKVAHWVAQAMAVYQRATATAVKIRDEFGMDPVLVDMLRPVFEFLYGEWWRVNVKDVKNIPAKGPAIIVANHSGMLPYDAVMINMAVYNEHTKQRNARFLVADFVDHFPMLSKFIRRAGGVKASPENGAKLLKKNELICVFPEGVKGVGKLYSEKYKLKEFGRGGVVKLAMQTGAPIIPCSVIGAEDIHPVLWKFDELGKKLGLPYFPVTPTFPLLGVFGLIPFPSKWTIRFGKPIRYKKTQAKAVPELTEELRDTVQKMVNEELIRSKA